MAGSPIPSTSKHASTRSANSPSMNSPFWRGSWKTWERNLPIDTAGSRLIRGPEPVPTFPRQHKERAVAAVGSIAGLLPGVPPLVAIGGRGGEGANRVVLRLLQLPSRSYDWLRSSPTRFRSGVRVWRGRRRVGFCSDRTPPPADVGHLTSLAATAALPSADALARLKDHYGAAPRPGAGLNDALIVRSAGGEADRDGGSASRCF